MFDNLVNARGSLKIEKIGTCVAISAVYILCWYNTYLEGVWDYDNVGIEKYLLLLLSYSYYLYLFSELLF